MLTETSYKHKSTERQNGIHCAPPRCCDVICVHVWEVELRASCVCVMEFPTSKTVPLQFCLSAVVFSELLAPVDKPQELLADGVVNT